MGLAGRAGHGLGGGGPRLEGASRARHASIRKSSRWRTWSPLLSAATSSRPRWSPGWRPSAGTWWRFRRPACKSGRWKCRGRGNGQSRYEVVIGPDVDAPERMRILGALQGLLKYAMTGGGAPPLPHLVGGAPRRVEGPRRSAGGIRADAAGNPHTVQLTFRQSDSKGARHSWPSLQIT